jgi:hypothetical protein
MPDMTSSIHEYFTEGYCHELALELNRRTGWELWACVSPGSQNGDGGCHALVRLPDGWFLDIEGVRDADQVKTSWPDTVLRRVSPGYFRGWSDEWGPVDIRRVRRAADKLLRSLQYETLAA